MKNILIILFLMHLTLSVVSCKKGGCFDEAGAVTKTKREISSFHQIDLLDNINLILTQDSIEALTVEAGNNMQPSISAIAENGILTIRNNTNCNWLRSPSEVINVYLSVKRIDYINYNGSGNITSTNTIKADEITFHSREGAGNIEVTLDAQKTITNIQEESADFILHGKSDECISYTNARGSIDFSDFEVRVMQIGHASVRDAVINVSDALYATLFHTGNLYLKGSAKIITEKSYSTGKVYLKN